MTTIPPDKWRGFGPATVIRGDARTLPLSDNSVDLIVTSPPYFALRSYQDGGQHYGGQIGSEPTPTEFVDALLECTAEMVRVLKPSGSIFVNLGDKYNSAASGQKGSTSVYNGSDPDTNKWANDYRLRERGTTLAEVKPKSLLGLPWRYALRCIDDLGLILRAEIIWSKPNGLPESVTDRVRRSHEQWFHFTTQPRYFAAVDEIREPHLVGSNGATFGGKTRAGVRVGSGERRYGHNTYDDLNPLGKLPGSVREVPSAPLKVPDHLDVDHFAAFPPAWPSWIIRGWSPTGICTACGEGRRPVVAAEPIKSPKHADGSIIGSRRGETRGWDGLPRFNMARELTGYDCACPEPTAPTTPATVLDPFGGTGTTAMAARALGRHGITVDLSADYCRLAQWRCTDLTQLAKAAGKEPPKKTTPPADAPSLFDLPEEEAS